MSLASPDEKKPSLIDAFTLVQSQKHMAYLMGANDYEPSAFQSIEVRLQSGEITPEEAIAQAHAIVESKQDYH